MHAILTAILAATLNAPLADATVSTEWLNEQLQNPGVVIVEIGVNTNADRPHIPGARYIPIDSIVHRTGWPPDELPKLDDLRKVFENAGIGDEGRLVLYSSAPLYAARAWFTLDFLGHGDRTAILDGGFEKWRREGRPVATTREAFAPRTFTPHPQAERVISQMQMQTAVNGKTAVLIDARPAAEFHGTQRGIKVARKGHIPGANNIPWPANLDVTLALKPQSDLRALYQSVGVEPGSRVIVYCRTGMEASLPYFVLRSLGYDVALYDGSYAEWSSYRGAGVATSVAP